MSKPAEASHAISTVAKRLDVHPATLRLWVNQAEVDQGTRPVTTTPDAARIAELERENRELKRANEILKAASAFFASMTTWWCPRASAKLSVSKQAS
ncbi:transposase [Parafrankia sp. FMc2]